MGKKTSLGKLAEIFLNDSVPAPKDSNSKTFSSKNNESNRLINFFRTNYIRINPDVLDFDGEIIAKSPSEVFHLAKGYIKDTKALVLFTLYKIVAQKEFENSVEECMVSDSGTALILSDGDSLLHMSSAGCKTRSIGVSVGSEQWRIDS